MVSRSAAASSIVDALTRSVRPLRPWVPVFQASMPASTASLWCTANTGPSTRTFSCGSVTTTAISMIRSRSGTSPVISRSIQIRLRRRGRVRIRSSADRKRARRQPPKISAMNSGALDTRLRARAGRFARPAHLAREPAGAARGAPPRRRARALPGHGRHRRAPQGRRLHPRPHPPRPVADGVRRRHLARLDLVRRPRPAQRGRCSTPILPHWGSARLRRRPVRRGVRDRRPAPPAARPLRHLRHRGPLRLQPHDLAPLAERRDQGRAAGHRHRRTAGGAGALDHVGERSALVAVGVARLGGLQPDRAGARADR